MTDLGILDKTIPMTKKITKKSESIQRKVKKMVKSIVKKAEKKKTFKPSAQKSPKKSAKVIKKVGVKTVDKDLIEVLKPLLSLPGSLRGKGVTIMEYAQSAFCDLPTLKADVKKVITLAESIGSGPYEDIKKYLKKM